MLFGEISMNSKKSKIFALTLLTALLVFAAFGVSANVQSTATVIVADSVGETTDSAAGTTSPCTRNVRNGYCYITQSYSNA